MARALSLQAWLLPTLVLFGCSDGGGDSAPTVPPPDQCLAMADMDLVNALQAEPDGGAVDGGIGTRMGVILSTCARGDCLSTILGGGDVEACMDGCMLDTAAGDLSMGCRGCFIYSVVCAQHYCAVPCLGNDDSACTTCSQTYCTDDYHACIGFPLP